MRILHLTPHQSAGGAERQLALLAPGMANHGHDVHIGYLFDGHEANLIKGVDLHRFLIRFNHDPRLLLRVRKLILALKPDIVQTWIAMMDIIAGLLSYELDFTWVLREPTSYKAYINPTIKQQLRQRLSARSATVVCNSIGGLTYWRKQGLEENRLHWIPNGIPQQLLTVDHDISRKANKMILYAGRLTSSKNVSLVIEAMISVIRKHEVSLLICGKGPELSNLKRLVDHEGLTEHIKFMGHVETHELWNHMKTADALISMSSFEGMPNSVCEAAACKTPLILSEIPGHTDIFDESSAFLTPIDTVVRIAEKICYMLENPEEASKRAQRAFEIIRHRSEDVVTSEYLDLYGKLLNHARHRQ